MTANNSPSKDFVPLSDAPTFLEIEQQSVEANGFTEGGVQGWCTVVGVGLILFATFGNIYSFGVYQDYYTRIYLTDYSASQISWIGSFQLMMPFGLGLVAGKLYNEGHFHILVITGSIIYTFGIFMLSLCQQNSYYEIFLSQALCQGVGLGLTFVPAVTVTNQWFKRRGGLATGLTFLGTSAGAVVFPILLNKLFYNPRYGFASGVRVSGYLAVACLVVGNLLTKTRYRPKATSETPPSLGVILRDVPYMAAVVGQIFVGLAVWFPVFYIQLFAIEHGLDTDLAFYSLAILNAGSAVGRGIANWLVDYTGPFNVLVPSVFIAAGTIIAMLGITSSAALVLVSFVYGFFSGAYLTVLISGVAFLSNTPAEIAIRMGLAFTAQSLASLVAAPIQGALLTPSNDQWNHAIAYSATLAFAGAVTFVYGRQSLSKKRQSQRV